MNLMQASNQWALRPADERFWDLDELHAATVDHRSKSGTVVREAGQLKVLPISTKGIALVGDKGHPALLTYWAFTQLCARAKAPASYLRGLPSNLTADALNWGLSQQVPEEELHLLIRMNQGEDWVSDYLTTIRAVNSSAYTRIWNHTLVDRLRRLPELGWRVPPARPAPLGDSRSRPATAEDVLRLSGTYGLSVEVGDLIGPSGLYASEEDLFVFMVNDDKLIEVNGNPMARGFFLTNSEVRLKSLKVKTFLYASVCGNHIVWGARDVKEICIRHVGKAPEKAFETLSATLTEYANSSTSSDVVRIKAARSFVLGGDKEAVVDTVFAKLFRVAGRRTLEAAYDIAVEHESTDGEPNTQWGVAQGLTRLSQESEWASERTRLDEVAGAVLDASF